MTIRLLALVAALVAFPTFSFANSDALAFFQTNIANTQQILPSAKPSKRGLSRLDAAATGHGPAATVVSTLAAQHGVPQRLALAVCQVETRCRFGLVGRAGERGPLQIKLQTARGLGYQGTAAGLNGHAGAYWGVKHLAVAYRTCGTASGAAKLHNAGLASSCRGSGYARKVLAMM